MTLVHFVSHIELSNEAFFGKKKIGTTGGIRSLSTSFKRLNSEIVYLVQDSIP